MRDFVKRAPIANGFIEVNIVELTEQVYLNWIQRIQPVIRELPTRLDRNWPWPALYRFLPITERLSGRELAGYAIQVKNDHGYSVSAGLVLLSKGYPALDDEQEKSVFLWYLTTAPREALQPLNVSVKPRLLEIMVDIAMVQSVRLGYCGRIGLHAADETGNPEAQQLLQLYQTRCNLLSLPSAANIPSILRHNDGRYFYTTPSVAERCMHALDHLR